MNRSLKSTVKIFLLALVVTAMNACKKSDNTTNPDTTEKGQYSALVAVGSWPNTAYYIADVPSLTSGTLSIAGNGAELTGKVYAQDVLQKDGFYYHLNSGAGRFGKYHVDKGVLVTDKEIPFTYLSWSTYTWVDSETLVIFGDGNGEARYAIVKVKDMTVTTGKLGINANPAGFVRIDFGFAEYRGGKIFIGYGFGSDDWTNYPVMPIYDKSYVAVVTYPAMTVDKSIEETRSAGMGGSQVYAASSFVDETGDIYFISDPINVYNTTKPSAVYRIKNGSNDLDPTYFFNFSSTVSNGMGAAMWYIGNGKAIVRTRVAGNNIDADHSFSLIDVKTGTFIKKLDLPTDKGERMVNAVIVEDGKAYIAVNAADKDYIWEYDPATDKLTKGLEFIGGIDYILRIEKLK
ncbi:DUF4374 domain-containing protein [Mucilaginibacter pedocola]|uniref:DUF4374 domain-containing protein n=1 Tax=Mucilaginibacter pedocola TaxID=1792845 RepID=A0A1S9PCS4_9SPHI|nr:DUF4374 domain-containing protein [Mucilaginibacter pedocola]OOQ58783.1 hypothetical protein BC343_09030 [Mucilaginibacter pedocola]